MNDPLGVVGVADDASDVQVLVLQLVWRRSQGILVDVWWAAKDKCVIYAILVQNRPTTYMEPIEVGCVLKFSKV